MKAAVRTKLRTERLEERTTPAVFGTPWADATHLTLSLAPDGTLIGAKPSNLFNTLDAAYPRAVWQRELLRAVQLWTSTANVNVGRTADGGQPFGASGSLQGDSRFGDIRIGATQMSSDSSAVAVPPNPFIAGTWAGDIVLNSSVDWTDSRNNLCGLMLHEVGHALGLEENDIPTSAMYRDVGHAPRNPSPRDVADIQALYGRRPMDAYDTVSRNDSLDRATVLSPAVQTESSFLPLVAFADIGPRADVDVYAITVPLTYTGPLTVRLVTAGVSLLQPNVTILDAGGQVLSSGSSQKLGGDVLTLTLPTVTPGTRLYIKVDSTSSNAFDFGRYALAVTFDARNTVPTERLLSVLQGPYDRVPLGDLGDLLRGSTAAFLNNDNHLNDRDSEAFELKPTAGYAKRTHYASVGSLSDAADVDVYKFETAESKGDRPLVLTIGLTAYSANGVVPKVVLVDPLGQIVPVDVIAYDRGQYTVQATGIRPGSTYLVRVVRDSNRVVQLSSQLGNYSLAIDSLTPQSYLSTFASGQLGGSTPEAGGIVYVAQNQVMHIVLSVDVTPPATTGGVQMTITDAGGNVVFSLVANAGETVSEEAILLAPGEYRVSYRSLGTAPSIGFKVRGQSISDPAGPIVIDPTHDPFYQNPDDPNSYLYPDGTITRISYLWLYWVI